MKRNLLSLAVAMVGIAIAGAGTQASAQTAPADVQAVDLGLPSGLKWASCNIGATTPEGYGDYYAWGETAPKEDYSWENYKYANGNENKLTKYCSDTKYGNDGFVDNKTVLEPADDAATANWGKEWRMPTDAEWTELREQCTWTWTTQKGVNGYQVASKTNSNSIFLPAAGFRTSTYLLDDGSNGSYRSSSLRGYDPSDAWSVDFSSDYVGRDGYDRRYGQSVRPVQVSGTGTGIGDTAAEVVATDAHKIIRNGQILIEKNGKNYTIMGQELTNDSPNPLKEGAQ